MKRRAFIPIVLLALAACSGDALLAPSPEGTRTADATPTPVPRLDVLTWNVYVGARLEDLLQVGDPNQIPFEVANLVGHVIATDFPARAEALADQIAASSPDVVSLQEISVFRTQSPGDFLAGNPVAATDPFLDWLQILAAALTARGLDYAVASQTENFDIELPMVNFATGGLDDIRLTDYDVILVRNGVGWSDPADGNYAAFLPIEIGGLTVPKPSGWASIDLVVHGQRYRYMNTHLEAADIAPGIVDPNLAALQAAQLAELAGIMDSSPYPVILTGDLNSSADGSSTETYEDLLESGFVDTWLAGRPLGPGYTSNQAADLLNPVSQLFHRIDFVLFRNRATATSGHLTGSARAALLGEDTADRTPSGLWPSDHAGVFVSLSLAPGNGIR